jgi:hypothetical protein
MFTTSDGIMTTSIMKRKKVEEEDCFLISDDDEEACQIWGEWPDYSESDSFEWPEEEKAGCSREMLENDELRKRRMQDFAAKYKPKVGVDKFGSEVLQLTLIVFIFSQEAQQQSTKKMKIAPLMNSSKIISLYAYKGDLRQGLSAAHDIQLWQPFSDTYIRSFNRVPYYKDIVFQAGLYSHSNFFRPLEQQFEIKVEHIKDLLFRVVDVEEVEKNGIGLESSSARKRAGYEELNTDDELTDDDVQIV